MSSKEIDYLRSMSRLEMLPDEIFLCICGYLRGADILYSFYNLNERLNRTISDYYRYVNLMNVSHQPFSYSVSRVLPQIGSMVRIFVLNGNWETIISKELYAILFQSNVSNFFPRLEKLILKWFTGEKLFSFVSRLENCFHLIELNIQYLRGEADKTLLHRTLCTNNHRLRCVSFDQDSCDLSLSDRSEFDSCPNIDQLTVNLTLSEYLPHLFQLVPNVISLYLSIDELSDGRTSKETLNQLPTLGRLLNFQLRSINLFWTFEEIVQILQSMPSLERLTLDFRTDDSRLVDENELCNHLPDSLIKFDYFIRYYVVRSENDENQLQKPSSLRFRTVSLFDEPRSRFLIHTIGCHLRSVILPANVAKQMSADWKNLKSVEDLCIYDATNLLDIILILQHFRHVRTLTVDIKDKMKNLEPVSSSVPLYLPYLKQIDISGISSLLPLLQAAPNLDYLIVYFDCLETLILDETTCDLLHSRISRLNVSDWTKIDSQLLSRMAETFASLRHLVITMKDSKTPIDDFVLTILSLWNGKRRLSFDVKGSLSDKVKENLRQWIIEQSHLTENDSFATECNDNWFDLWY